MTPKPTTTTKAPDTEPFVCPADHSHGSSTHCYNKHRCRCGDCREKNRQTVAGHRERVAAGLIEPLIRITPRMVKHVRSLRESGMTVREIAELAGVYSYSVSRVSAGDKGLIAPITAESIMGVTVSMRRPPEPLPKRQIPSLGTRRRLQALIYMGWPTEELMRRAGMASSYTRIFKSKFVMQETADAVATLFDQLWQASAPNTVAGRRAALRARRNGWVGPLAWEDIDNDAEPTVAEPDEESMWMNRLDHAAVEAAVDGLKPNLAPREREEAVKRLHVRLWSAARIAAWLGCQPKTVERIRQRLDLYMPDQNDLIDAEAA